MYSATERGICKDFGLWISNCEFCDAERARLAQTDYRRTNEIRNSKLLTTTFLEPDHSIRPTLDVQCVDKANVTRLCRHYDRMSAFACPEESNTLEECAVC